MEWSGIVSIGGSAFTSGGGSETARRRGNCRGDDDPSGMSFGESGSTSVGVTGTVEVSRTVVRRLLSVYKPYDSPKGI